MFLAHIDTALRQLGEHLFEALDTHRRCLGAVDPTNIVVALIRWSEPYSRRVNPAVFQGRRNHLSA